MNATKFVVLLILVGVVCANVGATRQLQEVSKETKSSEISVTKTASTKGLGSELTVMVYSGAYHSEYGSSNAASGPSSSSGFGSTYGSSSGYVTADGPNPNAYSSSYAYGSAGSNAAAGPNGATSNGYGYGDAGTYAGGSSGTPP